MFLRLFNECNDDTGYISTPYHGNYKTRLDGRVLYIFFQRSRGVWDWLSNFDFAARPYRDMAHPWLCHRGFLRVWRGMRDMVSECVAGHIHASGINSVVCVGYSHGGALCALAVEDLTYRFGDKIRVEGYGIGAPRVVCGVLPSEVRRRFSRYFLFRARRDMITRLPPRIFGFCDADNVIVLPSGGAGPIRSHMAGVYAAGLEKMRGTS